MNIQQKPRFVELDGLRALAILAVFVFHGWDAPMLWMGVDLFFVLSGFLITGILLDTPKSSFRQYIGRFYERRVRRILPPYLLFLALFSLTTTAWLHYWYLFLGLTNALACFTQAPWLASINSLWSLAVEEQFYLFWPVVVFFVSRKNLLRVLVAMIVAAPLLRGLCTPWVNRLSFNETHWFIYSQTPFRMDCLAMGSLLTFVWRAHSDKVRCYGVWGLPAAAVLLPVAIVLKLKAPGFDLFSGSVTGAVMNFEIALITVTMLFVWGLSGRYTAWLRMAPMRWLARISYTFYLVHPLAMQIAVRHIGRHSLAMLAAFCATCAFGELSWRWMEHPILHGGNRRQVRLELAAAEPEHGRAEATDALKPL